MTMNNLHEAMVDELKDILSAEQQITDALPRFAKKAHQPQLRDAFQQHLQETNDHIARLKQVFQILDVPAKPKKCEGAAGIIEEGEGLLKRKADPATLDAFLIASAQKLEHYEIAAYGTVCAWAARMGRDDICDLLRPTLNEEKEADEHLTRLAESINLQAVPA